MVLGRVSLRGFLIGFVLVLVGAAADASTLCVRPGGSGGCYATIGAAVIAAQPGDTVQVGPGTYKEGVVIGQPLSLVGADPAVTIIDASHHATGVFVDGLDNPGLSGVVVAGFTVENADFEGVLVANASAVTVWSNSVLGNNRKLDTTALTCAGLPVWETSEAEDCGEGIHLTGVDHSTISGNLIRGNSGGILLSDDTGATHDNLVSSNSVLSNPYDCGITLASHPPAALTQSATPLGVFHNTVAQNQSADNGKSQPGAGAGVGIFDSIPGAQAYGNVVVGNRLTGNGLPGVTMHSHAPGQNLDDNVIVGNYIAGNGRDTDDAATSGPTGINLYGVSPVTGTVIAQNTIANETIDIAIKTPAPVEVHLNNLLGPYTGIDNLGSGTVDATQNWWGCAGGPSAGGCAGVSGPGVTYKPWLALPFPVPQS